MRNKPGTRGSEEGQPQNIGKLGWTELENEKVRFCLPSDEHLCYNDCNVSEVILKM